MLRPLQMVQTRALPAAGRGRGRPPLDRGRGQILDVDPHAAVELSAEVVESVASGTRNGIAERHIPQRVQSDDPGYISMSGPDFRAYIR